MSQHIVLPSGWVGVREFESALGLANPLQSSEMSVRFDVPTDARVKVDAAVRMLCVANQMQSFGKSVALDFSPTESPAFGYLERMGFFPLLHPSIAVKPRRPDGSVADRHRGRNDSLVEFARIRVGEHHDLPRRLEHALLSSIRQRARRDQLGRAAFTLFAELIGNVIQHSRSDLDGYAVLQVYRNGSAVVAVSDSGLGLFETLKPALPQHYPKLVGLSDADLLVEIFRNGVSQHGRSQGLGLKRCAECALEFGANLEVRLPMSNVRLQAKRGIYRPVAEDSMPLMMGTHIAFDFRLD